MAKPGPRPSAIDAATGAEAGDEPGGNAADRARARLVGAAVTVLARDGFAHASARAIAAEAGGANGLIYYHFGSMDRLLAATARVLAERGTARIKAGLGGDDATRLWPDRLAEVIRSEAEGDDGRAVLELLVGARTSPTLQAEISAVIGDALGFIAAELRPVVSGSPVVGVVPPELMADVAGAAFLGLAVLLQNGRDVDIDRLATTVAAALALSGWSPG
ncbi:MAG: TetR family transcriptional regulator [Acidimicrobiales bacterium]